MGPGGPGHVGIYIGGPNMIDAPHSGAKVRLENYHWDTYVGATRPWDK
jgi:cell wall-associated NlpC family hydrolase